jgi:hypothetical protein
MEESALGKFTGTRQTSAFSEAEVQHGLKNKRAAMSGNLHHVFSGVAVGGAEDGDNDFVNQTLTLALSLSRERVCLSVPLPLLRGRG